MSRWMMFLLVLATVITALSMYVHRRTSWAFAFGPRARRGLAVTLFIGVSLLFAARFVAVWWPAAYVPMTVAGSFVGLAVLIGGGLLLHIDLARGLGSLMRRWRARGASAFPAKAAETGSAAQPLDELSAAATSPSEKTLGRRELLERAGTAAAIVSATAASGYGCVIGRTDFALEEVPVRLPGLRRSLEGYTIVQLSDVHIGTFVGDDELGAGLELVRRARPDLVVLTGDLLDHDPSYADQLGAFVQRLGSLSRDGVAAALGNHDHYAGIDRVVDALRRGGAQVLRNSGRVMREGGFSLLGVDDPVGAPDLGRALAMTPDDLPRVLLAHRPRTVDEAASRVQLQLSGHTHGGQVTFLYNPADLIMKYVRGRYRVGGTELYVNRGFGTAGPPARVGSAPEVTKIVLTS